MYAPLKTDGLNANVYANSAEYHAGEALDLDAKGKEMHYIPWYEAVVSHHGAGKVPNTNKVLGNSKQWGGISPYLDT